MSETTGNVDLANEPVDVDSSEFMDTGVLHEKRAVVKGVHVVKIETEDGRANS